MSNGGADLRNYCGRDSIDFFGSGEILEFEETVQLLPFSILNKYVTGTLSFPPPSNINRIREQYNMAYYLQLYFMYYIAIYLKMQAAKAGIILLNNMHNITFIIPQCYLRGHTPDTKISMLRFLGIPLKLATHLYIPAKDRFTLFIRRSPIHLLFSRQTTMPTSYSLFMSTLGTRELLGNLQ